MQVHPMVSRDEWLAARRKLLAREKEFTRERDRLSAERRALPWLKVEKSYVFEGPRGRSTLDGLFDGRSQLIVYHFMFGPDWEEGCKSCSFWADNFDRNVVHLKARDVSLVAVSRAPLEKLEAFRRRMGWSFPWLSSLESDFNFDFHVSFTAEEMESGRVFYNYTLTEFPSEEAPGVSVFYRDADGDVFHTYSTYGRGLDMLNAGYHYLDLVPRGRDEEGLSYSMEWVRHRDRYGD